MHAHTSLVVLPVTIASVLAAHAVGYRLATGSHAEHDALLAETGHGYLETAAPVAVAFAAMMLLVVFVWRLPRGLGMRVQPSAFAVAPPLVFVVQENAERVMNGTWAIQLVSSPEFLLGLALQAPFSLFVYAGVRLIARLATRLARPVGVARTVDREPPPRRIVAFQAQPMVARGICGVFGDSGRAPPAHR